jgi:DNA (cytosine-5)-methyltransferase 1
VIDISKPPYRVPSMAEIAAIPWNGFKVASTFSGCGGSCLGYRMAGFRVVWANEFVPAAQASYKANATEDCYLDCRDVKHVQPADIFESIGLAEGDLDLFDGSPPCQAFSTAGKREKGWGQDKAYEHGAKQKNETLFDEYIRLLRGLKPKMFVAENVSGLVKGTAKGYFLDILAAMKASGYRVGVKVLDAQWLGVPQRRQRVIFIGVREDLGLNPIHPTPLLYCYSVRDALPWIGKAEHDISGLMSEGDITNRPSPAVMAGRAGSHFAITGRIETGYERREMYVSEPCLANQATGAAQTRFEIGPEKRKFTIAELKRICAFPDDFVLLGSYAQQWERLGNSVPPLMAKAIGESVLSILNRVEAVAA